MFQRLQWKPLCTYPGYDELPGVLVVGVNPLSQQRDEAHQVKLVALRHNVLQNPSRGCQKGPQAHPKAKQSPPTSCF